MEHTAQTEHAAELWSPSFVQAPLGSICLSASPGTVGCGPSARGEPPGAAGTFGETMEGMGPDASSGSSGEGVPSALLALQERVGVVEWTGLWMGRGERDEERSGGEGRREWERDVGREAESGWKDRQVH